MKYLVFATGGPGFDTSEDATWVLEEVILPGFDALIRLEAEKKILAGGVPLGERSLAFVIEAQSNEELDWILRGLPLWPSMNWEVTPLQTFAGRADQERDFVERLRRELQ